MKTTNQHKLFHVPAAATLAATLPASKDLADTCPEREALALYRKWQHARRRIATVENRAPVNGRVRPLAPSDIKRLYETDRREIGQREAQALRLRRLTEFHEFENASEEVVREVEATDEQERQLRLAIDAETTALKALTAYKARTLYGAMLKVMAATGWAWDVVNGDDPADNAIRSAAADAARILSGRV